MARNYKRDRKGRFAKVASAARAGHRANRTRKRTAASKKKVIRQNNRGKSLSQRNTERKTANIKKYGASKQVANKRQLSNRKVRNIKRTRNALIVGTVALGAASVVVSTPGGTAAMMAGGAKAAKVARAGVIAGQRVNAHRTMGRQVTYSAAQYAAKYGTRF